MIAWKDATVVIAQALLEETYVRLLTCGQRRRECQLFWVASWRDSSRIARIVHPKHTATSGSVEIDTAWLNGFFIELADREECIRVQVHSHPGSAFHSATDDRWPAVRMAGYLSLVIPDFASGNAALRRAYLAEQDATGGWVTAVAEERIRLEQSSSPSRA